jgi:hypothetical protein
LRQVPPIPGASENFWLTAYDRDNQIGIWTHLGRTSWDPYLWREIVVVYLPSGDFLLSKCFGRHETRLGPGAATLSMTFTEPWNSGVVTMDGAAVQVSREEAQRGRCGEGEHLPVHFELSWNAFGPPWVLHQKELDGQSWADCHYEQLLTVDGTLTYGDQHLQIRATGMRDHSRGARDLLGIPRHTDVNCVLRDSGRGFLAVELPLDGGGISRAVIIDDGRLVDAELVRNTAMLSSVDGAEEPFELELRWAGGQSTIHAEIVQNMPMGFVGQSEFILGLDRHIAYTVLNEAFVRFTWDGEVAYGLVERSFRHRESRSP